MDRRDRVLKVFERLVRFLGPLDLPEPADASNLSFVGLPG